MTSPFIFEMGTTQSDSSFVFQFAFISLSVGVKSCFPHIVNALAVCYPKRANLLKQRMRFYLTDQSKNFRQHLEYLRSQPVMQYERSKLTEKITVIAINTTKELRELNTGFLSDYKIFPSSILIHLTEWANENRQMKIGDTIVQQAFIPPFRTFSLKIVFGVRINNIINEPTTIGFSYETLKGHVERGVSIFTIEKTAEQKIIFKVHTFSQPGNLLTKLAGPAFSVPFQAYCTRQGLLNVKRQLESS